MLVAVTGQKRSGKDTFASVMVAQYGFEAVPFAGPMKGMIRTLLLAAGLTEEDANRRINGSEKEKEEPLDVLQGKSCRHAMQTLGTEWRDHLGKDLWIDIVKSKIETTPRVIITDMRFPHEGDYVDERHGYKVRIRRFGQSQGDDLHPSERLMDSIIVDATIYNSGTLEEFLKACEILSLHILAPQHSFESICE